MNLSDRSAVFSPCRLYRYELWRRWSDKPACVVIGLNPSTADENHDDPTVRRCIGFARRWGYGSLCMANLFAFRATDPKVMLAAEDPVGPENDLTLRKLSMGNPDGLVLAAWGNHGAHIGRAAAVVAMLQDLHCLARNKDGSPAHPLYLKSSLIPIRL